MINQIEVKIKKTGMIGRLHFVNLPLEKNCNYSVDFNYKEIDKCKVNYVRFYKGNELKIL